jgi:hypothetical protein
MAYVKTTWVDRLVEFANRFTKSGETSTEVTLTASPGTVTAEGTPLSATNLNKIEQGIVEAHTHADNTSIHIPRTVSLATSTDLNTIIESGFYRINATPVNAPVGVDYGQLIVSRGGDTIFQTCTGHNDNSYYMRQGNGIGGIPVWQPWRKLYHDANKPTAADVGALPNTTHLTTNGIYAKSVSGDWNNITETGFYMGSAMTNQSPGTSWRWCQVIQHNSSWIQQTMWSFGEGDMYIRTKINGVWSAWKTIWHSGNSTQTRWSNGEFQSWNGTEWVGVGGTDWSKMTAQNNSGKISGAPFSSTTKHYDFFSVTGKGILTELKYVTSDTNGVYFRPFVKVDGVYKYFDYMESTTIAYGTWAGGYRQASSSTTSYALLREIGSNISFNTSLSVGVECNNSVNQTFYWNGTYSLN